MSTLINIRYQTPITNVSLLRCPCCAEYYNKPDTKEGLFALLQHCTRSHKDKMTEIRKSIYSNNPEDENLIKSKGRDYYRRKLLGIKILLIILFNNNINEYIYIYIR